MVSFQLSALGLQLVPFSKLRTPRVKTFSESGRKMGVRASPESPADFVPGALRFQEISRLDSTAHYSTCRAVERADKPLPINDLQ